MAKLSLQGMAIVLTMALLSHAYGQQDPAQPSSAQLRHDFEEALWVVRQLEKGIWPVEVALLQRQIGAQKVSNLLLISHAGPLDFRLSPERSIQRLMETYQRLFNENLPILQISNDDADSGLLGLFALSWFTGVGSVAALLGHASTGRRLALGVAQGLMAKEVAGAFLSSESKVKKWYPLVAPLSWITQVKPAQFQAKQIAEASLTAPYNLVVMISPSAFSLAVAQLKSMGFEEGRNWPL